MASAMVACVGFTPVTGQAAAPADVPDYAGPVTDVETGARIDLTGLEPIAAESRASLGEALDAAAGAACEGHGFPAEKLSIEVRWRDADTFDYLIVVELDADAGAPASRQVGSTGPDARHTDLVDVASATMERAFAERMRQAPLVAATPVVPLPIPPVRPAAVAPRPLRKVQRAGIGLMFGGARATGPAGWRKSSCMPPSLCLRA